MRKAVCVVALLLLVLGFAYLLYESYAVTTGDGVYVRHEFPHQREALTLMLVGAVALFIALYIPSKKE